MSKQRKQCLSGILAIVIVCTTILSNISPMISYGANFKGKNIWTGGSEQMFGKNRNYLYRWSDGYQMTFCIDPGDHMGSDVRAGAFRYNINDDDIPYISSREDFERLALICDWFDRKGGSIFSSNASYAAAQGAVWAVVEGQWDSVETIISKVNKHVAGTAAEWAKLKEHVETAYSGADGLPVWCSTVASTAPAQNMELKDGMYKIDFDISEKPELALVAWDLPSTEWGKSVSGNTLTFTYTGTSSPIGIIKADAPASMQTIIKNSQNLTIFIPEREKDQAMVGAGLAAYGELFINIGGSNIPGTPTGDPALIIYNHQETFESHYNIDLTKYCAETNQLLEGSTFDVLEAFDDSQLGSGMDGSVSAGNMSPTPVTWNGFKTCGQILTDENGYAAHQDIKYYDYNKTYCGGHPEPEYVEASESGEDGADEGDAAEEENERLRAEWEALIALCEEETDFHDVEEGVAETMMLEDREETYDTFIHLEYDYTIKEVLARYGYILHGKHNDDEVIPTIRINSSEAGADCTILTRSKSEIAAAFEKSLGITYSSFKELVPIKKSIESMVPDLVTLELEDARIISNPVTVKSKDQKKENTATSSDAMVDEIVEEIEDEIENDIEEDIIDDRQELVTVASTSDAIHNSYKYQVIPKSYGTGTGTSTSESKANTMSDDDDIAVNVELPAPIDDDIDPITPKGTTDEPAYHFIVHNRRTEGQIHINKRDLEIFAEDPDHSYGITQGDATLEGAVYGLYAAADILHPDGKTKVVYKQNDLVAIATTDIEGDASFLAYTEESENSTQATNLDGRWIGHPLILGNYYIKELSRSEGYELSVYGINLTNSNRGGTGTGVLTEVGHAYAGSMSHPIDEHDGSWNEFEVTSFQTEQGYDIVVTGYPVGSTFYTSDRMETTTSEKVVVGTIQVPTGEFEKAGAGEKKLDAAGNYIPVMVDGELVYDITSPISETYYTNYRLNTYPKGTATPTIDPEKWADINNVDTDYIAQEVNSMLLQIGYKALDMENGDGAPWLTLTLSGTTNREIAEEVLDWYTVNNFWDSGTVHRVYLDGLEYQAELFYDYRALASQAIYDPMNGVVYVRKDIAVDGGAGTGSHMFLTYPAGTFALNSFYGLVSPAKQVSGPISFMDDLEKYVTVRYHPLYETYGEGDYRLDQNGQKIPIYKTEFVYGEQDQTEVEYGLIPIQAVYDDVTGNYTIHVENTTDWTNVTEPEVITYRAVAPEKSMVVDGEEWYYSDYLTQIKGAGSSAFASLKAFEDGTYIKTQPLVYPGQLQTYQDGNTKEVPVSVLERAIKQQVKVTKTIDKASYENRNFYSEVHEDWFTKLFGGFLGKETEAVKMDNFRFKTYLKSNIEQLYRDEQGEVVWQDKKGTNLIIDGSGVISEMKNSYPELVQPIFTKVQHKANPLYQDSREAILANATLYNYTGGQINKNQNSGYTAILETNQTLVKDGSSTRMINAYNYEKYFDAIAVANQDKWDDKSPTYTSWQPIGNEANRTEYTIQNARVSDKVRQFAIDWYLEDEIAKLVKVVPNNETETEYAEETVSYSDELYDKALDQAILKTENYLKPFFAYDLDEIYAIAWDREERGGSDQDKTTLSADTDFEHVEGEGYYYGVSQYLPYGTYLVVEQQPKYDHLGDFANKHYQIDKPKEVTLPSAYASYEASQTSPEVMNDYYNYSASDSPEELSAKYGIRFNEENHVIQAHSHEGDFEIYKYGLDIDQIANGVPNAPGAEDYFALTQSEYRPFKNYYNAEDNRVTGDIPYYLTEGQSGRSDVSKYYRYSSVAEDAGIANDVPYLSTPATEDNPKGIQYRDQVMTMNGKQTAYDGKYASMLVPYTMVAPVNGQTEKDEVQLDGTGESSYIGYGYVKFTNRLYTSKLRIEKLDSETHENILHDEAIFHIYAAKRDSHANGTGSVLFYEEETTITGTIEFLNAMGAKNIIPFHRQTNLIDRIIGKEPKVTYLYSGQVPAGTPVCEEREQIILDSNLGNQTAVFKSYTTVLEGLMKDEDNQTTLNNQRQTVGYLETPQPLGAGVYVICEVKAPTGYARSKPVAVEVYSDKITYYKEANRDHRVIAALYERPSDNQETNGAIPQGVVNVARINVENAPIKLTVEKVKESSVASADTTADKTVTYRASGRVDGTLVEIGSRNDLEYAFNEQGTYLGYAWKKGTLENLVARKNAGEQVEIIYEGKVFAGYGYITKTLETADDKNKYIVGATMTLFDAIEVIKSGNTEDHGYKGLIIERTGTNNITRMYVKQGYAGEKIEFLPDTSNVWSAITIQRPDTDILYYDLGSLDLFTSAAIDGKTVRYGYNKDHEKVSIEQLEADKVNIKKTDTEYSIYAFKGGIPYLEFVNGDFNKIFYSPINKVLSLGAETVVYHIDQEGNRDAMVDPYTGMAYVIELQADGSEKVLTWPVNIAKDQYGNVIARSKITTSRIATIGEHQDAYEDRGTIEVTNNSGQAISNLDQPSYFHTESGYITGSWNSESGEESHKETTKDVNKDGSNRNESVLIDDNNGTFSKDLNPVYDAHGLPIYYQRSEETYDKGTELYDRNKDFVRYQDSDNLEEYNNAAYRIQDHAELYDGNATKEEQIQKKLYHRQGESYILENTWRTSDKTPNDPFNTVVTEGQADILKRVPIGNYIMEELIVPTGFIKGMPTGITISETASMHHSKMVDKTTKIEISKRDSAGTVTEGKGIYGYGQIKGAELALYEAEKVYTTDLSSYPSGYYLKKKSATGEPYLHLFTDIKPAYIEEVPKGYYLLEEINVPAGFVKSQPMELYISGASEVQIITMEDDHTKVEIEKYVEGDEGRTVLAGAGFALYEAILDDQGEVVYENEKPQYDPHKLLDRWYSDDGTDYTDHIELSDYANTNGAKGISGFQIEFEKKYQQFGTQPGSEIHWSVERSAVRDSVSDHVWRLEDGSDILVDGAEILFPETLTKEERTGFQMALAANENRKDRILWTVERSAYYLEHHQIDYTVAGKELPSTVFPTSAVMIYQTDEGKDIRITIYQETANRQGKTFTFEYQFDYRKLSSVNEYACSWLTANGRRRFDYLPVEGAYVLVETEVPKGFIRADDQVIYIRDTDHVQLHDVENEESMIRISKVSQSGTRELAGATLALYRADESENFTPETSYLVARWKSGEDGIYTEQDAINGRIPDGYKQGDLRPHTIKRLPDGVYYVAEVESPDYYMLFEPVRIDYQQADGIKIIRISNVLVTGEVIIEKTDTKGNRLSGVVVEVKAYRKGTDEEVLTRIVSDTEGRIVLKDLPVGEISGTGEIIPYTYKIKEKTPPDGYAIQTLIHTFEFKPDKEGVSYLPGESAIIEIIMEDEITKLYIEKRAFDELGDLDTDGIFIEGAELALYKIHGKDEEDNYIYSESDLLAKWITTREEGRHLVEGLKAGRSYLLKELKAPSGYDLMKPVIITVSQDGRRIIGISNQWNTILVNSIGESEFIESITVKGRYVSKVLMVMNNHKGEKVAEWIATGNGHVIELSDTIADGEVYTLIEHTIYSDGSDTVTNHITGRIHFDEHGRFKIDDRGADKTMLSLSHGDGTMIKEFSPSEIFQEETILNNINPENPKITMRNSDSFIGGGLNPRQTIFIDIAYVNTSNIVTDIEIIARPDLLLQVIDTGEGEISKDNIQWTVKGVQPSQGGRVTFAVEIINPDADSVGITATIKFNKNVLVTTKEIPLLKPGRLTVFHELTGSGKIRYQEDQSQFLIYLFDERGEELKGRYRYQGSKSGELQSGDGIVLKGNEFITIDPGTVYKKVGYRLERVEDEREDWYEFYEMTGTIAPETGTCSFITRAASDTSDRQIFVKGGNYLLTETTRYTNGEERNSNKLSFMIDEDGGIHGIGGYDKKKEISVLKINASTGKALSGAVLQIRDLEGMILEEWISREGPYQIATSLKVDIDYLIHEKMAPDGFMQMEDLTFTLQQESTIMTVIFENEPKPEEPPKPPVDPPKEPPVEKEKPPIDPPKKVEKVGRILVFYEPDMSVHTYQNKRPFSDFLWPKTGEEARVMVYLICFVFSSITSMGILYKRKKKGD